MENIGAAVRSANDEFRRLGRNTPEGRFVITDRVDQHPRRNGIIAAVMASDASNDPYQEHDFGQVSVNSQAFVWKIDYYDSKWEAFRDPYEHREVNRMLTICEASEW